MTWTSLQRVVGLARRSRRSHATIATGEFAHTNERRRLPTMAGVDVPPVHGRHCICPRCERSRAAG